MERVYTRAESGECMSLTRAKQTGVPITGYMIETLALPTLSVYKSIYVAAVQVRLIMQLIYRALELEVVVSLSVVSMRNAGCRAAFL